LNKLGEASIYRSGFVVRVLAPLSILVLTALWAPSALAQVGKPVTTTGSNGLLGSYYSSTGTTNGNTTPPPTPPGSLIAPSLTIAPFLIQVDPILDGTATNFQTNPPPNNPTSPGSNDFVTAWDGFIIIPAAGAYIFNFSVDDGARLWIGTGASPSTLPATPQVDMWGYGAPRQAPNSATINFAAAGNYALRLEYFEGGGQAVAQLLWQPPGGAALVTVPTASILSPTVPPAPTNLQAVSAQGSAVINLSWNASPTATSYMIFKSTSPGGEGTTPLATVTGTTYQDTAVMFGTRYYYVVQPMSYSGCVIGPVSNEVSCAPNPIAITPATMNISESGGTGTITLTIASALPNGATLSIPVSVQNITSGGPSFFVSSGGSAPGLTATVNFTGTGAAGLTQTVTVTGQGDLIASDPQTANINFGTSTSSNAGYSGLTFVPVVCTQIEGDSAGVVVTPASGLSVTNGGPPVQFFVQLSSIPASNVTVSFSVSIPNLATVSGPITFTSGNWNVQQPVTVTPLAVDASTTYVTSFFINFAVASGDTNYNGLAVPPLFVFEPTTTPPLNPVWKCGLLGLESLLPLLAAACWRRRRSS